MEQIHSVDYTHCGILVIVYIDWLACHVHSIFKSIHMYTYLYRTRVIPHVMAERTKPVTELPAPSSNVIYDVHVYEPHRGTHTLCIYIRYVLLLI